MAPGFKKIDVASWARRKHYELYAREPYPYVGFTVTLDITGFLERRRARGVGFFNAFLHAAMRALHSVENFRYRAVDGEVLLYETMAASFTVFDEKDCLFYFATAAMAETLDEFAARCDQAKAESLAAKCLSDGSEDLVHVSCSPWFDYTDLVQPVVVGERTSAIPKIFWGKFRTDAGRTTMPFSVTAHHSFVDAYHIHRLLREIEGNMAADS